MKTGQCVVVDFAIHAVVVVDQKSQSNVAKNFNFKYNFVFVQNKHEDPI